MTAPRKPAAASEALGEHVPFTFEGLNFRALPTSEWTGGAIEAFELGRIMTFLREILHPEDYPQVRPLKASALGDLVVELQKALGIEGN